VFHGRDPVAPPAMTRSLLRARPLLSLAIASALMPACVADGGEPLDDESETTGFDEAAETDTTDEADTTSADTEAPSWRSLARNEAWQPDLPEDDPLPEHRPAQVECDHGWALESGGIEVRTDQCNYLSLQQPLLAAIEPGDPLHLELWWQTLASVEPAQGHLALFVDDELLWEELVPLPGPADARSLEFPSPLRAPAGATLTLHLHNHGYNAWHFHELSALGSEP
jgi:hypothetical protein